LILTRKKNEENGYQMDRKIIENHRELESFTTSKVYQRRQWEIALITASQKITVKRNLKQKDPQSQDNLLMSES